MFSVYQLFTLDIMQYYDFWLRIDTDIRFLTEAPNIGDILSSQNPTFIQSAFLNGSALCFNGLTDYVNNYGDKLCKYANARNTSWYRNDRSMWYGNFVGGWLGFHTSPEVLHFAKYFYNDEDVWNRRWTDQHFFIKAYGLFFRDLSNVLDLGSWRWHVFVHKE